MDSRFKNTRDYFLDKKARVYKKGQIILHADDFPNYVYYVEKGFVKCYSITEKGQQKTQMFYKAGDIFPLIGILTSSTRELFFESMEETSVRGSSKQEFMAFIKSDNKLLLETIERILDIFNVYVDRVDTLGYEKTYNRLLSRLLNLSKRFGRQYGKSLLLDIPVTHKDLADSTAMSRETVSREIETLQKKGILVHNGRLIVVKNVDKLKNELDNNS